MYTNPMERQALAYIPTRFNKVSETDQNVSKIYRKGLDSNVKVICVRSFKNHCVIVT